MSLQAGEPPRAAAAIDPGAAALYTPIFHALLAGGVALAPSAYEAGFLSLAHERHHLERLRDALEAAFQSSMVRA
jgi:glutamate-1-semialdehyde 2,1-aminomutase